MARGDRGRSRREPEPFPVQGLLDTAAMVPSPVGDVADVAGLLYEMRSPEFREQLRQPPTVYDRGTPDVNVFGEFVGGREFALNPAQMRATSVLPIIPGITNYARTDPQFVKKYVEGNYLVDESSGQPIRLMHGTGAEIDKFDLERQSPQGYWGRSIYTSDTPADVAANYTNMSSPDQQIKLSDARQRVADLLLESDREEAPELFAAADDWLNRNRLQSSQQELLPGPRAEDAIRDIDRYRGGVYDDMLDELSLQAVGFTSQGTTYPLYGSMKNPVVIGGNDATWFSVEEAEEFLETIEDVASQYRDGSAQSAIDEIVDDIQMFLEDAEPDELSEFISADRLQDTFRTDDDFIYYSDDEGNVIPGEIIRETFERMGYDGIVDKMAGRRWFGRMDGVEANTTHVIFFNPEALNTALIP